MALLMAIDLAGMLDRVLNIGYVALGLGLVIFFHELGHFAVAKWCGVYVERFSIGFGPVLWGRKWGETEYALSLIPFGGYVKMLGQDDSDPHQMTRDDLAQDPRSYSNKTVLQRMAIISAGVVMNILTSILFFAVALGIGVESPPAIVGSTQIGLPAWKAGLRSGDTITAIDGRPVDSFSDITRYVAFSRGDVSIQGTRRDGQPFSVVLLPDSSGTRRVIGVENYSSLTLFPKVPPGMTVTAPGSGASKAQPPFEPGDTIVSVGGTPVASFPQLQDLLARRRSETLEFVVARGKGDAGEQVKITVPPTPFRRMGLMMDIGTITEVKDNSPAAKAGLQKGDKITSVNGEQIGTVLDPVQLPDKVASLAGQSIDIVVNRPTSGESKPLTISVVPSDEPGWIERPNTLDTPVSVPALGIAYRILPTVLKVEPGSPAEKAGIQKTDIIRKVVFTKPEAAEEAKDKSTDDAFDFVDKQEKVRENANWGYVFWYMQQAPPTRVQLTISRNGSLIDAELTPDEASRIQLKSGEATWFSPTRGFRLMPETVELRAEGPLAALEQGWFNTRDSVVDIYLTLRNLVAGLLSPKELHGPVGIAMVAFQIASQGFPYLLLFLGFLSVNLAVLNFLPIPVLDGGHMVFLLWEAVTRRRPNRRVVETATLVGVAFVIGLMMFVLYLDIFVHRHM